MSKKNQTKESPRKYLLRNFFGKYFFIGVTIICIACILNLIIPSEPEQDCSEIFSFLIFALKVLVSMLQTVGIAFMLGAIFDFSKNTEGFVNFISKILADIVVGKSFLSQLENNGKMDALKLILRPTTNQIIQYSRIEDYFQKKINDSMKMWDTNFKTNLVLNIEVRHNEERQVITIGKLTYRIYKVKDRYEDIPTVFERDSSRVSNTRLIYPGGIREINEGKPEPIEQAGMQYIKYNFRVPDDLYQYPYLTIERDVFEPGYDHWTNFHWTALTPYDGLVFSLRCLDGLTIKEHIIFDEKAFYNVTISDDRTEMRIISTDWLDANKGFSITISDTKDVTDKGQD